MGSLKFTDEGMLKLVSFLLFSLMLNYEPKKSFTRFPSFNVARNSAGGLFIAVIFFLKKHALYVFRANL